MKKYPTLSPVKAFQCTVHGYGEMYVPARTHSKARYIVSASARDAGLNEMSEFKNIRVVRAPKYDTWAQTAKRQPCDAVYMPKEA